jgi:hypothetical protein
LLVRRLIQATATFTWRSSELGGSDVLLTGSFNSWAELLPLAHSPSRGTHTLRCCLPQSRYQFQFFVDGQWLLCPTLPTSLTDQGRLVNRWGASHAAAGALAAARRQPEAACTLACQWPVAALPVPAAAAEAWTWLTCGWLTPARPRPVLPRSTDVAAPPAFHIHYATGWKGATLHHRFASLPGEPEQAWQATPMHSTASRARPLGGSWLTVTVPASPLPAPPKEPAASVAPPSPYANGGLNGNGNGRNTSGLNGSAAAAAVGLNGSAMAAHAASAGEVAGLLMWEGAAGGAPTPGYRTLEFFVTSSDGSREDRPFGGGTYRCLHPGGYKLLRGQLRPFPMATQPPMMLVRAACARGPAGTGRHLFLPACPMPACRARLPTHRLRCPACLPACPPAPGAGERPGRHDGG